MLLRACCIVCIQVIFSLPCGLWSSLFLDVLQGPSLLVFQDSIASEILAISVSQLLCSNLTFCFIQQWQNIAGSMGVFVGNIKEAESKPADCKNQRLCV